MENQNKTTSIYDAKECYTAIVLFNFCKVKTRKQLGTFLRVYYGKKKDRGYIKSKINKLVDEKLNKLRERAKLLEE